MNREFFPEGMRMETEENREALASLAGMERAMHAGSVLEYPVSLCDRTLSLHLELPAADGIIPPDEAVLCREGEERKDIAVISRVGKPTAFCIRSIEHREGRPVAILSRRMAQKRCIEEYLSCCREGDILWGRVTHLEPFGAFLDVGCGVPSLLSVDCISVSRISHPKDRLQVGDRIPLVIRSIDRSTGRIYVSLRELLGTWEENAAAFSAGQTVTGIVRSVEPYGVFVELSPNLAGLAELREGTVEEARRWIGRSASVYIKSILPERMKVKLVLIDTLPTPPAPRPLHFFIDATKTEHLSHWLYSPPSAARVIETRFEA